MTTEAGNIIIGKLIGISPFYNNKKIIGWTGDADGTMRILGEYTPHEDWNELMSVYRKIIELELAETEDMCIREPWGYMQAIRTGLTNCDIKETRIAIVKLLQWYNNSKADQ